jgi:prolyl 4-hydroxylase
MLLPYTYVRAMVAEPDSRSQDGPEPLLARNAQFCHECPMQQSLPPLTDAYSLAASGHTTNAIEIIERHAESGSGEALFALGDVYWRGVGVPQDLERARELFARSSESGFPMADKAYTNLLANGVAGGRDWSEALRRLEVEAKTDGLRERMLRQIQQMELDGEGNPLRAVPGERLCDCPDVMLYRGAFSSAECEFLRILAEPTYQRAGVVISPGDTVRAFIRTADGSTIHWLIEDPATHAMNRRLATLTETDVSQGEPLQILRYQPGQEYRPHLDWLDVGNRRVMTALIYLNDDYEAGETAFTKVGLKVKGRPGDAIVFKSQGPDGELEPLSEHAGLPVLRGTNYLGSRWIRERAHTL